MLNNLFLIWKAGRHLETILVQEYNYLISSFILLIKRISLRPVLHEVHVKLYAFLMAQPYH